MSIGRTNAGFATLQEYQETEKRLRGYQERLYETANKAFNKIEAKRGRKRGVMSDEIITIRVHGLTPAEIFDKLGGFGRDKPVRAIDIGANLFAVVEQIRELADKAHFEYETVDPFELKKIIIKGGSGSEGE